MVPHTRELASGGHEEDSLVGGSPERGGLLGVQAMATGRGGRRGGFGGGLLHTTLHIFAF